MRPLFHAAVFCYLLAEGASAEFPTYQAPRTAEAPVLDGRLDDAAWTGAPVIADLVTNHEREPARFRTEFRFVYDREALYAAVTAFEPNLDQLQVDRDPNNLWWDDNIEIFLDPQATRTRYYQFIINSTGAIESAYTGDFAADIPAEATAGRTGDAWTLEVRIPIAALGAPPCVGQRWGLNVSRSRNEKAPGEERETTIWSPTGGMHGGPGRFGYLIFAPPAGGKNPLEGPDRHVTDAILKQIAAEMRGRWRWTNEDVPFETRNTRAQRLLALNSILARFPDTRLLPFVRPAIVDEHVLPWTVPDPTEVDGGIELVACRGEFEPVSLSVFAVRDLRQVTLDISPLSQPSGETLPATIADPYHVVCWYQSGVGGIHPSRTTLLAELLLKDPVLVTVNPKARKNRLHFDPIPTDADSLQPINIPAFESRQFWVRYRVPKDALPGTYRGTITIRDRKGPCAELPVRVRVPDWDLEPSPMLHGFYYGRRLPELKTVEEENAFFKLVETELRNQIEHGCNVTAAYINTCSLPSDSSPTASAQRVSDIQKKYGITGTPYFSVLDHVGPQQGEEILGQVTRRAQLLSEWARSNNRDGFCFQGRDEASGERLTEQRPSWEACRQGGGKVWVACRPSYFESMGDILDYPVISGRLRPELAMKIRANGSVPLSYGNPQVGVELPALYRRNYGLALWAAEYSGSINYHYRLEYTREDWDDFRSPSYRGHNFVYSSTKGPIDTIQYEGWREAVDDIRYVATLQRAIVDAKSAGRNLELASETEKWLDGLTGYEDLDQVRAEMIHRIDTLTP